MSSEYGGWCLSLKYILTCCSNVLSMLEMGNLNKLLLFDIFCWWNISVFVSSYCHLISARNMLSSLSNHPAVSEYWLVGSLLPSNPPTYVRVTESSWLEAALPPPPLWLPPGQLLWRGREMVEKDVEAEAGTNMCGDNLVVCGAVAEGLVVFIFILVVCLVVGFSAYWDLTRLHPHIVQQVYIWELMWCRYLTECRLSKMKSVHL